MKKGFGLIEVLVSGIVVISIVGATVSVRQRATNQSLFSRHQTEAYLLAQEALEAVRNIRDTNYLLTKGAADPANPIYYGGRTKMGWDCDITSNIRIVASQSYQVAPTVYGDDIYLCEDGTAINTLMAPAGSANPVYTDGEFGPVGGGDQASTELFSGGRMGAVPVSTGGVNHVLMPLWSLTGPTTGFDSGASTTQLAWNTSATPGSDGKTADLIKGVERVYAKEGTASPTLYPTPSNPGGLVHVLTNRILPVSRNGFASQKTNQENYLSDASQINKAGFKQYYRQIIAFHTNIGTTESASNLPQSWADDTTSHMIRVLVRVSWFENSRFTSAGDAKSVILATYLTDWRPNN